MRVSLPQSLDFCDIGHFAYPLKRLLRGSEA
jgi:hypothetical protein